MQFCGDLPLEKNSRDSNHAPHGWNINVDDVVERSKFHEMCQLQDTLNLHVQPDGWAPIRGKSAFRHSHSP